MRVSRSAVYVNVAITRSTRPVVSAGSRAGVVTHVYVTRLSLPKANRENHFAISTSKPAFFPRTSMYPNGGESHFTPMFQRFRSFTSSGSGGSADVAFARVDPIVADGCARPSAATNTATRPTPIVARTIFLIQPL